VSIRNVEDYINHKSVGDSSKVACVGVLRDNLGHQMDGFVRYVGLSNALMTKMWGWVTTLDT
jgi:hypothetical protein